MIDKIKIAGKYLDQPLLVAKFNQAVPKIFVGGAALYGVNEVRKAPKEKRKETAINTFSVLTATVATALAAPKLASKIVKKPYQNFLVKDVVKRNTEIIDEYISKEPVSRVTENILQKSKTNVLSYKEVKTMCKELRSKDSGKDFLNKLIPEPENITSKDIKNEIGRLSILGLIPVAGGVVGGITGEKISKGKLNKENTSNRVKEGAYQYLANIFLCNVGAGIALAGMEACKIKSKASRAIGMTAGIVATGIVGGSKIANFIGKKVVDPIFDKKEIKNKKNSYSERKPEIVDICLHTDDIATIAVMSGLKWIEPALPILYGISGYRAGIGYRNNKGTENKSPDKHLCIKA